LIFTGLLPQRGIGTLNAGPAGDSAIAAQVRTSIGKSAVKRWKNYGDGSKPLAEAIDGQNGRSRNRWRGGTRIRVIECTS